MIRDFCWDLWHWFFPFSRICAGRRLRRPAYETTLKYPPLLLAEYLSDPPDWFHPMKLVNLYQKNPLIKDPPEFIEDQAMAGDGEAAFLLGLAHLVDADDAELKDAERWIHRAALNGHTEAQLFMASWNLRQGPDGSINPALGIEWIRRAAESGNVGAQVSMAVLYDRGRYLPRDPKRAFRWYHRAYINGEIGAEVISTRLHAGFGVWRNTRAAKKWFRHAIKVEGFPAQKAVVKAKKESSNFLSLEERAFSIFIESNRHLYAPNCLIR